MSTNGQIVTATFSRGEDTKTQDCIDNECYCECHDTKPLSPGTYITIKLDHDIPVGFQRVKVEIEEPR